MAIIRRCAVLALLGLIIAGCTKDSDPASPTIPDISVIKGNWVVLAGMQNTSYLSVHGDNVYYFLHQYPYGLRSMDGGVAQVSGNTVLLGSTVYNYAVSGDTVRLTTPTQTVVAVKSSTAPSDSQWVSTVSVLDTMSPPIPTATDMTINGNTMWYGNGYASHNLYKINLTTRSVDTLPTSEYAWAVEWDGTSLWTSSDGSASIYKVNPTLGVTAFTSTQMGAWIYGIAWDGTVFWCTSNNEQTIYKYNPGTDAVVSTYPLGSGVSPEGVAYANGYLYVCTNGVINKCTPSPFNTVAAYRIAGIDAFGLAYDGAHFWVSGQDANYKTLLYKVNLP